MHPCGPVRKFPCVLLLASVLLTLDLKLRNEKLWYCYLSTTSPLISYTWIYLRFEHFESYQICWIKTEFQVSRIVNENVWIITTLSILYCLADHVSTYSMYWIYESNWYTPYQQCPLNSGQKFVLFRSDFIWSFVLPVMSQLSSTFHYPAEEARTMAFPSVYKQMLFQKLQGCQ